MTSSSSGKPTQRGIGKRGFIFAAIAFVTIAAVIIACFLTISAKGSSSDSPNISEPETVYDSGSEMTSVEGRLPFSIEGVPIDADIIETAGSFQTLSLRNEWTFGGDYVSIGSFPIDENAVFGSHTNTPNDSSSYAPALLQPGGTFVELESSSSDEETAWEPQDGSGSSSLIVWRSSSLSFTPFAGEDNWRISLWRESDREVSLLGSAESLNGTDSTPILDGEIIPTVNDNHVFFASMMQDGDNWLPKVLAYNLSEPGEAPDVLGSGSYPSATCSGAIWAGDALKRSGSYAYCSLFSWDGKDSERIFSLTSNENSWSISGTWASETYRAVCFSSDNSDMGCYLGIWSNDFTSCLAWIHSPSSQILASLNEEWLVWGTGSDYNNPNMFAMKLSSKEIYFLGSSPGYSRPSIARECNVVIAPECDGESAAIFHVGTLE